MTGPAPDAAGYQAAAVVPPSNEDDSTLIRLLTRLRNRWWIIAAALVVCLVTGGAYLAIATPEYDVTAILMAEQAGAPVGAGANNAAGEFLSAQRRALLSPPVQSEDVARYFPSAEVDQDEGTLTISVVTDRPREAASALSGMLE